MSVKPIIPNIDSNTSANKIRNTQNNNIIKKNNVSFGGTNFIVDSMDFIEKGGYAVAFCIQDGIGFIFPRVGKGLVRGSKKKDENGNPILDENGKQVREYNWALARKELLRELITGPSAFVIPWAALKGIKKVASGNNVKLNYIDGFNHAFTNFASNNLTKIKSGTVDKTGFYQNVFEDIIENSVNAHLTGTEKMSKDEIKAIAQDYANRQIQIEQVSADKTLSKQARAQRIGEIGPVEESFMKLKKNKIGGIVDELAVTIKSTDGKLKGGSFSELLGAMSDYFSDAVSSTKKAFTKNANANLHEVIKSFTHRRMGTRVLTNLGLFGAVAAFYTQIPKLYNKGLNGDPALKGTAADPSLQGGETKADKPADKKGKDIAFGSAATVMEKAGKTVFNNKGLKSISDIFELNGPVISGMAMPVLLYGFCIPPRLQHAQSKYDYGEIVLRDMTSFTALLFGAKALSRLFSDGFTKATGLALNMKNLEGRNIFQKAMDYLTPKNGRHTVLSSQQLDSKYTNLQDYKGEVNGFVEFIEKSGGNIKKALSRDKDIKACVEDILKDFNGKSFAQASVSEIKEALKLANKNKTEAIKQFYELFKKPNGLLKTAKTCNSAFNFISSFAIVPGLIIWLTHACEKMTAKKTAEDMQSSKKVIKMKDYVASNTPTMAGFIGN